jgi:hypothetical protein
LFNFYLILEFQKEVYYFNPYDSGAYFDFSLYPVFRMPIITGIYVLISDLQSIVIFQYILYLLSATFLLISFYAFFGSRISSLLSIIFLSYLLTSTVIIEHNYKLTSEGMNNTSFLAFMAALLLSVKYKKIRYFIALLLALIALSGTKAVTALVSIIILPFIILKFRNILFIRKKDFILILVSILPLIYLSVATFSSDYSKNYTTSSIINERLWVNDEWKNQVIDAGYPLSARQTWEAHKDENLGLPPDNAVINNDEFKDWYENRGGENFLIEFMLKNPKYTLVAPFCLPCLSENFTFKQTVLSGWTQGTDEIKRKPDLSMLSENRTWFWPNEPENAYLLLSLVLGLIGLLFFVLFVSTKDADNDQIFVFAIATTYGLIYSLVSWYFGSKANDMNRHQLLMAIDLRIVSIFIFTSILISLINLIKKKNEADV